MWTRNKDFFIVETFVSLPQENVAIVRKYTKAVAIPSVSQVNLSNMNQLFQISDPGKLQVIHVREVFSKSVSLKTGAASFMASTVSEGFEYN